MLSWGNYRFYKWLMNKIREYPNFRVIDYRKEYTSQTCSEIVFLRLNFRGKKVFKRSHCSQKSDKHFNTTRNILLKNMGLGFMN